LDVLGADAGRDVFRYQRRRPAKDVDHQCARCHRQDRTSPPDACVRR